MLYEPRCDCGAGIGNVADHHSKQCPTYRPRQHLALVSAGVVGWAIECWCGFKRGGFTSGFGATIAAEKHAAAS